MSGTTEALRILVVSSRDDAPREVAESLSGRYGAAQIHWVSQESLVLGRAEDLRPHVILAFSDLGEEVLVGLVRRLAHHLPAAVVFVVVPWDGMALARQAVLVGARGFLVQPLDPEEVHKALAESLSRGRAPVLAEGIETRPSAEGKVVAFCAPKGGTGRTTLAVNTALSLRGVTGQSVVLVDADYAAPALDVALDLKHTRDVADLVSRIARLDEALVDGVLGEHASGVKVLLAPPPTRGAPPVGPAHVQQIVAILRRMFDWVVVDVGLPHDAAAYGYLGLADRVVLNVLPEMIGLRNTQNLLARLQSKGIARERIWVVVNRATLRGGLPLVDIQGRMAIDVAFQIPDDQPAATESVNRGIPLVVDRRYTALAKAMRALAKRLAEDLTNPQPPAGFVAVETGRTGPGRTLRWPWVGLWAGMGLGAVAAAVVLGVPRLPALRAALGGAQTPTTAAVAQGDTHLIVAPSAAPQETLEPSPPPATSTALTVKPASPAQCGPVSRIRPGRCRRSQSRRSRNPTRRRRCCVLILRPPAG